LKLTVRKTPREAAWIGLSPRRQISRMHATARIVVHTVAVWAVHTVAVWALCGSAAPAQIVIDNTSSSAADSAVLSFAHTINAGANSLLMVGVAVHGQTKITSVEWGMSPATCSTTCTPSSCLCALQQVGTVTDSGKNITVQLWALENPPNGTADVVVTLPSSHRIVSGATSLFGVDHTTPLGKAVAASGDSGTPASVQVATAPGGLALDAVGTSPNTTLMATGSGQQQLYQGASRSSEGVSGAGSTLSRPGTVTMSWSLTVPHWALIAVPINAAPTPTGGPPSPTPSPTPTPPPLCVGDCSGSHTVSVNDIIAMVDIALGTADPSTCPDGIPTNVVVGIADIIQATDHALNGCGS